MNRGFRTTAVSVAALVAAAFAAPVASADAVADFYKDKTVRILIGGSMGGSFGFYAQIAARHMVKFLPGSPSIIVQSMTGASGNNALNYAYNVGPQDGTLVILPNLALVQETLFNTAVRYNARDFQYLGRFTDVLGVATASQRSGIRSLGDLRQRQYTIGTVGTRNMTYWGPALMNKLGDTKLRIISGYSGVGDTYKALEQGEVDVYITSWTTLKINHSDDLKAGRLIPVFGVATRRLPDLPNVPVVTEFGKTDAEKALLRIVTVSNEIGRPLAGPPGMPGHLVAAWRTAFDAMVADPAFRTYVTERGGDLNTMTGQELTRIVHETMDLPKATVDSARALYDDIVSAAK